MTHGNPEDTNARMTSSNDDNNTRKTRFHRNKRHKFSTCNEVWVVAALSKFHHCVEKIGYIAVLCGSHAKEAEVTL